MFAQLVRAKWCGCVADRHFFLQRFRDRIDLILRISSIDFDDVAKNRETTNEASESFICLSFNLCVHTYAHTIFTDKNVIYAYRAEAEVDDDVR